METKKKLLPVFIAVIISFVAMICTMPSFSGMSSVRMLTACTDESENTEVEAYADTALKDEYDSFLFAYYRNLSRNMGNNVKGSCGYVANAMLLSYYDTYLCDDIIPEEYDANSTGTETNMNERLKSPGIYNDTLSNYVCSQKYGKSSAGELSPQEYYDYILEKSEISEMERQPSLHAKLITIGYKKGYYIEKDKDGNENKDPCVTDYEKNEAVLRTYLTDIVGLTEGVDFEITVKTGSSNSVKNFVKTKIDEGYPVFLSVYKNKDEAGHACIAYYCENDEIYCNMGYIGKRVCEPVSENYNKYNSAMIVDFKMSHQHTNNYIVTTNGVDKAYCYCSDDILTFHTHRYNSRYVSFGEFGHKAYCSCAKSRIESHSWEPVTSLTSIDNPLAEYFGLSDDTLIVKQKVKCRYCGYIKILGDHEIVPIG